MPRISPGRVSVYGAVVGASVACAFLVASPSGAAPYRTYTYPTPTYTNPSPTPVSPSTTSGNSVTISGTSAADYAFVPKRLKVKKGATVDWSWHSNAPHNVTFTKLGKHSATGDSGSYQLKFKKTGKFKYFCSVHGFRGTIVVKRK